MLHTSGPYLKRFSAPLVGIHRCFIAPRYRSTWGGWGLAAGPFPLHSESLPTAAGFVLGHLRRCVMRTGVQNENISAPCGLPFMSRVTEVRGYQKTFSISSRVERTTIPLSETSSSVPACL